MIKPKCKYNLRSNSRNKIKNNDENMETMETMETRETRETRETQDIPTVEQIVSSYRHLDNVSEEQLFICNSVQQGKNVIVDACAGSGKSTTVLSTCRFMPQTNFLMLTFNRALRTETREKVKHLNIQNAEIHTYHSLAVQYYDSKAHTDNQMKQVIKNNTPLRKMPHRLYDIIVLDEAQDMTLLYYNFIKKFTQDLNHPFQLFILGDYRQCLYQFKGSNLRYLTCSESIWKNTPLLKAPDQWINAELKTTYRLTHQMANFVNNVLLGEQKLNACRDGPQVKYFVSTLHKIPDEIFGFINRIVKTEKTGKYDDFFILSPSIKKSYLIKNIENELVTQNVPCHIPLIEDSEMDERVIENKVVFCTFHSSKGRQRKYVIVLNFDNSYFDFNERKKRRDVCPNTIYVATTRATTQMYIYEQMRYRQDETPQQTIYSFDFLKMNHQQMQELPYIEFIHASPQTPLYIKPPLEQTDSLNHKYFTSPTELTKFLSCRGNEIIYPIIDKIWQLECKDHDEIFIPNIIQTSTGHEDVCDLNGIVIPLLYYDWIYNSNADVLRKQTDAYLRTNRQDPFIKKTIAQIPQFCNTVDDYLFLANITQTIKDKLHFRLKQINNNGYNWLTQDLIDTCMKRMHFFIPPEEKFKIEETIITPQDEDHDEIDKTLAQYFPNIKFRFTAIVDVITDRTIWELKCTNDITFEHKIQVVVYAWLWQLIYNTPKTFRILNIKSGEVWRLKSSIEDLTTIMVALLEKYIDTTPEDDEYDDEANNQRFIEQHTT